MLKRKGWEKLKNKQIAMRLNTDCATEYFTEHVIKNWRYGVSLPRYDNFLQLAERLDCETTDLLSIEQQGILQRRRQSK